MYERRQNIRICMTIDNFIHQMAEPADLMETGGHFFNNLNALMFKESPSHSMVVNLKDRIVVYISPVKYAATALWVSESGILLLRPEKREAQPPILTSLQSECFFFRKKKRLFSGWNWSALYSFRGTEIGYNWTYLLPGHLELNLFRLTCGIWWRQNYRCIY